MSNSIIALLFISLFSISINACVDLTSNSSCNTGNCASGGRLDSWTIPAINPLPAGFNRAGYMARIQWDGQVLRAYYNAPIPTACCARCKTTSNCKYWLFVANHPNGDSNICFHYPIAPPTCDSGIAKNNAGGKCQTPGVINDPHFTGAHGTPFEFSGMPGKSFCLFTDRKLHMNMKMTGYLDERLESATLIKEGKAVRSWIRELGILWIEDGEEHTLKLVARSTPSIERGNGFLEVAEFDGEILPRLTPGKFVAREGGLKLKFESFEKFGSMDVDFYTLKIDGVLDMDIRLRVAHPLLRRADDAKAHISIGINDVMSSDIVHGVLGQTYRSDRAERAIKYHKIRTALGHDIVADMESGKGFLDGLPMDYETSGVLEANCRYTSYRGHPLPTLVESD